MKICKIVELGIVKPCNYSINKNGSFKTEAARRLIELIEKGNIERYQRFLPCFAYDYVLEAEEEMNKELTLIKVSSIHGN